MQFRINKKFIQLAPVFIAVLLIVNILLAGFIISRNAAAVDSHLNGKVTVTPQATLKPTEVSEVTPTPKIQAVDWGKRVAGTVEEISIYADPVTATDSLAMLRLYVENGEIINFASTGLISLGSCKDNVKFTNHNLCVDVAKTTAFSKGELLGVVTIKWGEEGAVYIEEGNGYYNGTTESFTISEMNMYGKVAGWSDSASDYFSEGVILIIVSAVILFIAMICAYMILRKKPETQTLDSINKKNSGVKIMVIASFALLAGAIVYVSNTIAKQESTVDTSKALTVTVIVTATPSPTKAVSPVPTVKTTSTPTVTVTLKPTVTSVPTVTPITDNVPVTCGALDSNADKILNYIDYQAMIVVYNHQCADSYPEQGCGGKDTNDDGVINYLDLYYLVSHQYPDYIDCTRY